MAMMILPEEVRGIIFNYIPQKESLKVRLVCRAWNQDVQNHYKFNIEKLDEDSPNFQSILQLQIKELTIHRLKITPVYNHRGQVIFKHPNAVRKLVIKNNAIVARLNLPLLIGLFSENIREIDINVNPKIYNNRCPLDLCYDFKHLRILSIRSIVGRNPSSGQCEDNPRSLFQVLENSSFLKVEKLDIVLGQLKMTLEGKARIVGNLLRLISKLGSSLRRLQLIVHPELLLTELTVPLKEEELQRIKQIDTIGLVNLCVEPLGLATKQFWTEFLLNQKKLMYLHVTQWCPFYPISVPLLEEVLKKNCYTLETLSLELKPSQSDHPFDLSIFKNRINLKHLKLFLRQSSRTNIEEPDVKNLHCLPQNLARLDLNNLIILSSDLLNAFTFSSGSVATPERNTRGFMKLHELNLVNCGNSGRFGVNGVVLYEIMMTDRPSLTRVDFRGAVRRTESSFKTVLDELNIPEDADLRLMRNSASRGWDSY